ncbi:hypothetical protein A7981_05530 [Methylovorus sp. MM2]|uniref:hypothetical protein n=1 Tax=Methylovorus sp. MM2 TaxID=1848038 RepID=UPI0007E053D8|nr:hypothetical protein [Methylovorus sp. MM2]OAM52899.1 hypothetical protein A7981_05530 [Methylovorus sp. MM2]
MYSTKSRHPLIQSLLHIVALLAVGSVVPSGNQKPEYLRNVGKNKQLPDHRAYERNKYAPWGRGVAGGKAVAA